VADFIIGVRVHKSYKGRGVFNRVEARGTSRRGTSKVDKDCVKEAGKEWG